MTSIETVQYDVDTLIKKLKEHVKTGKQITIDLCHIIFAEGKVSKEKVGEELYKRCRDQDFNDDEINVVRHFVPNEFKDHSNDPKSGPTKPGGEPITNYTLENLNLNEVLPNKKFEELKESTTDIVPIISKYELSEQQLDQLSKTEENEYWTERDKIVSSQDEQIKVAKNNAKEKKRKRGIQSASQALKESTVQLPEELWGKDSLSWRIHDGLGQYHDLMSKAHYDFRDNIEKFKPTKEIQEEHKQEFLKHRDKVIVPLANIDAYIMNFHKTMMDNVTDEKYGDTIVNMFKAGEDKFWNAGNHGSGEINSILTGKYIGKLKTNQDEIDEALELGKEPPEFRYTVVETPIEREYTREQMGDETKFSLNETKSLKCVSCGHENFYKLVPVEVANSMLGDWIHKARIAVVGNGLSNQIETICDHVAIRKIRSPVDILKYYNKKATDEDIQKLDYIFSSPEKMKSEEIDSKAIMSLGYNIIYGRAGRRHNKAPHFSAMA